MSNPTGSMIAPDTRFSLPTLIPLRVALFGIIQLASCGSSVMLTAKQHYIGGRPDEARQVLEEAIAEDPQDGKACLFLALIEMEQDDCEGARERLEYVSGLSEEYRETVEQYYLPILEEYESIMWVEVRPEPRTSSESLYRFVAPLAPYRKLQTVGDWTQVTIRHWFPNDDRIDRYRNSEIVRILYETPEMVYADITGWADRGMVIDPVSFTPRQGANLLLISLDYCPTEVENVVQVYGIVINDGTVTVREPVAQVHAIYVDLNSEMMVSLPGARFTDPILRALDMTMMPRMDRGEAVVPIRPQELQPGQHGIIVLTVEIPDPNVMLLLDADFQIRP